MKGDISRRTFLKQTATTAALLSTEGAEKLLANVPTGGADGGKKAAPALSLPKGGGGIKGIGETFKPNPFTGTGNFSVPVALSPGRGNMTPQLALQYSTGNGNGPFGLGWSLGVPMISRKTEKGIPVYDDKKDTFLLSGTEDLVPFLREENGAWVHVSGMDKTQTWHIYHYRPRIEGLHARIEFWRKRPLDIPVSYDPETPQVPKTESFWVVTTKDNIVNIYGYNPQARLSRPDNPGKIFEWRLECSYDAKGNCMLYQYKPDFGLDERQRNTIFEDNRYKSGDTGVFQTYLSAIQYGNRTNIVREGYTADMVTLGKQLERGFGSEEFCFTIRFDYGEFDTRWKDDAKHYYIQALGFDSSNMDWHQRPDPFSSYRSGFEVRNYRRCQRILLFHNGLGRPDKLLVRSIDFHYQENTYNGMSMLTSVVQRGYRLPGRAVVCQSEELEIQGCNSPGVVSDHYAIKSLPPLSFQYSGFEPHKQTFKPLTADSNDIISEPMSNPNLSLVDLHGTGLSDFLLTSDTGYYYWANKGQGNFSSRRTMKQMPANVKLNGTGVSFGDMAGDGQPDLLVHEGSQWGFFELNGNAGWQNFKPYKKQPSFDLNDGRSRLMDLTGDGRTDLLRTDENYFYYFPCLGEEGWDKPKRVKKAHALADFPDIDFSNPRVKLADMTGDGMQDIVLVHDGRIDYWANIGYGRFSRRITLKNAPHFGFGFDPKRLFFADIDGSGTADMIYVEGKRIRAWFNQSGNTWSDETVINGTPAVNDIDTIQVADLYGSGCQGLLWSAVYGRGSNSNYRFLDFTNDVKPNLLVETDDNMGVVTRVEYKPSTWFFLEDKKKGRPWATTLPFPVQCVERVEHMDHISRSKLTTRYAYHHGYYDGREREFRGFACVEQWDAETFDLLQENGIQPNTDLRNQEAGYHVPPVLTKTWYHTGAYLFEKANALFLKGQNPASDPTFDAQELFRHEYYKDDINAFKYTESVFEKPNKDITERSGAEAYRALAGQVLRQEVYALDGSERQKDPYTVTEAAACIRQIQPQADNRHAVFQLLPFERISYYYERNPKDPRIAHEFTLQTDQYGNVEKAVSLVYPRRNDPVDLEQKKCWATYSKNAYINREETDWRYISLPLETQTFELFFGYSGQGKVNRSAFNKAIEVIAEQNEKKDAQDYIRRISWQMNRYKSEKDAEKVIPAPLLETNIDRLALPLTQITVVFHDSYAREVFSDAGNYAYLLKEAGYFLLELEGQQQYWCMASGQQYFDPKRFFLPYESYDPFFQSTKTVYDTYSLLPEEITDPLHNAIRVKNDYISLQPYELSDPNGVISRVAFDALGAVVATGTIGKNAEGDPMQYFKVPYRYWESVALTDYYHEEGPQRLLDMIQDASAVMLYDLWRGVHLKIRDKTPYATAPQAVLTFTREEHHSINTRPKIQTKITYFDGLDRELQTKIQAEPDAQGNPHYITSGWKIYNNKGKPVRQFEPFYSDSPYYESLEDIYRKNLNDRMGCSSVLFYDPLDRQVCLLHPNYTYEKIVFNAWEEWSFDVNDTVDQYPGNDPDIKGYVEKFLDNPQFCFGNAPVSPYITWADRKGPKDRAVQLTWKHRNTPAISHLDTLGRAYKTVQTHTVDGNERSEYITTNQFDTEGNVLSVTDPRGVKCFEYQYDMMKRPLVVNSADAGKKTMIPDVAGMPLWTTDAMQTQILTEYDALRRPTEIWVKKKNDKDYFLAGATVYGELKSKTIRRGIFRRDPEETDYFRGKVWKVYDGAGMVENTSFDFKGNILENKRSLIDSQTITTPEWTLRRSTDPLQETSVIQGKNFGWGKTFVTQSAFDALNRVVSVTLPDGTIQQPVYNPSNLLRSVTVQGKTFVEKITYNAKGQREEITYGNGVTTRYNYEQETYRLIHLYSARKNEEVLQDLNYSYDPAGNILEIIDESVKTVWCNNQLVDGVHQYQYDSLYRLIFATGREHEANNCSDSGTTQRFKKDKCIPLPQNAGNALALRRYAETFAYDPAGNLLLRKRSTGVYSEYDPLMPGSVCNIEQGYAPDSNRIVRSKGMDMHHDDNGNLLDLFGEDSMIWDYRNQLAQVRVQINNISGDKYAYYQYDAQGNRIRKYNAQNGEERIYIGGYEYYTKGNNSLETVHVMDDKNRIAILEKPNDGKEVVRYQLNNHLGSGILELAGDDAAHLISYEEYYAYGGTACFAACDNDEYSLKRYRYSGKERDEESGLYYYGARYYAPWMGRWCSCDPAGRVDGENLYNYVKNNPIRYFDGQGFFLDETKLAQPARAAVQAASEIMPNTSSLIKMGPIVVVGALIIALFSGLLIYKSKLEVSEARKRLEYRSRQLDAIVENAFNDGRISKDDFDRYLKTGNSLFELKSEGYYNTSNRLKKGMIGELEAAFDLAKRGHTIVYAKPDILKTNQGGIDIVTFDKQGVLNLIDNKSFSRAGYIYNVSSLTTNLSKSVKSIMDELKNILTNSNNDDQKSILSRAVNALEKGDFKLVVTNSNGNSVGVKNIPVQYNNRDYNIEFIDLNNNANNKK